MKSLIAVLCSKHPVQCESLRKETYEEISAELMVQASGDGSGGHMTHSLLTAGKTESSRSTPVQPQHLQP